MESIINSDSFKADIGDNVPSDYLPVKTNYNECDWNMVSGFFIGFAYNLELPEYSKEEFENDVKSHLMIKGISEKHTEVLRKAFFENDNYLKLAPTHLLLHTRNSEKSKTKVTSASKKIASTLSTLLNDNDLKSPKKGSEHFFGDIITSTLSDKLKTKKFNSGVSSYLPFLKNTFNHDFQFLTSKPAYMLENIAGFLSLYSFLYTSQIALNLKEWRYGEPESKPLFFVIETEKVSSERTNVIKNGWKSFASASHNLFPMLSTLQLIQAKKARKPLWQIYKELEQLDNTVKKECVEIIDNYCERFVEARNLTKPFVESQTLEAAIEQLFDLAFAQFDKQYADPSTTRYQANEKVVSALKEHTAKGFVKSKGRIGNILVLTQDYLLLLTNIIIGHRKQMRFNELVDEFKLRGVYFDEISEERLIEFYERIGNVERMSDSGDDLYVRQTA